MIISRLFILAIAALAMSACSSSKNSGSGAPSKYDFKVSDELKGHFEAGQDLTQNSVEAEKELAKWRSECEQIDGFHFGQNFKVGRQMITREDEVSLWTDLKPSGDVSYFENTLERIVSPKEFYAFNNQVSVGSSVKFRFRHSGSKGGFMSEMVDIISSNPPALSKSIQQHVHSSSDDSNYVRCERHYSSSNAWNQVTSYATLILADGTAVKGILVTNKSELSDYVCGLYNKNDKLIRKEKVADKAEEVQVDFYSKEVVNPFESRCYDNSGLLSIFAIKDASGKKGLIELRKSETVYIQK